MTWYWIAIGGCLAIILAAFMWAGGPVEIRRWRKRRRHGGDLWK